MIRTELGRDEKAVGSLHRAAFGGDAEANLVAALRDGGFTEVSLVAEKEDQIVGHILFSRLPINTVSGRVHAVSLAPLAVLPSHQRQGIGSKLVEAGLQACRQRGHSIAIVLGQPDFYRRLGFAAELARSLSSPFSGGEAWMALELVPGAANGIVGRVEYPPPFSMFE